MSQPDIMTVQEVAELLRVSERTVYDWASSGTIPCGKLGTTWRFKRQEVNKWVNEQLSGPSKKNVTFSPVALKDILLPQNVMFLQSDSKDSSLMEMLEVLASNGSIKDKDAIVEGIFQREKLMSTGIGLGIGIPHVRMDSVEDLMMAVGLAKFELSDYESLDTKPVKLIFMILARANQHAQHIKAMAAISTRVRNPILREMLMQAQNPETIYELLTNGSKVTDGLQ